MQSIDQVSDISSRELYSYLGEYDVPDFVKSAEADTPETVEDLPKEAFADEYNKAFPINTPARTFLSNVYFFNKQAQLSKRWGLGYTGGVRQKLSKAAELHQIVGPVQDYTKWAGANHSVDYVKQHVHTAAISDGTSVELFPYKTASDLTTAASEFVSKVSNFPVEWRRDISTSFVKAAEAMGVNEVPDLIAKYAGLYFPNPVAIKAELQRRSGKVAEEKRAEYQKFISKVDSLVSNDDYYKLAEDVYNFEYNEGLYRNYKVAQYLPDPVNAFFTLSAEKVAHIMDVVSMGDDMYAVEDLKKISSDIYKEAFGIDLDPSDSSQLREVLPTMPRSDIPLFRELSGISPI